MAKDFPLITFCKHPVYHYADETLLGRINRKGTDNLTMDNLTNYIENYHYNINTYVTNPYIRDDNHLVHLKLGSISTAVHHKLFGLCYTLDVHIEKKSTITKRSYYIWYGRVHRWRINDSTS